MIWTCNIPMSGWVTLLGCVFIAFVVGSNDASNSLGICIGCDVIKFSKALCVFGPCLFLGIVLQGEKVMKTVGKDLLLVNPAILGVSLVVSALLIAFSNWKKLPLSTHQVIISGSTGSGVASGIDLQMAAALKILLSWLISPLGAFLFSYLVYRSTEKALSKFPLFRFERLLRSLLIISSMLVAYNIGANDLATVLGGAVFAGMINPLEASFGGAVLAILGAALLSPRVIETVAKGITVLDPYSGFAAQFGAALCVLLFTTLGMPISTTYCIVGGVVGVGVLKGSATVRFELIGKMLASWVLAPLAAFIICFCLTKVL